jgi:hypothetical protein
MEVSGQPQAPVALPPGKNPCYTLGSRMNVYIHGKLASIPGPVIKVVTKLRRGLLTADSPCRGKHPRRSGGENWQWVTWIGADDLLLLMMMMMMMLMVILPVAFRDDNWWWCHWRPHTSPEIQTHLLCGNLTYPHLTAVLVAGTVSHGRKSGPCAANTEKFDRMVQWQRSAENLGAVTDY